MAHFLATETQVQNTPPVNDIQQEKIYNWQHNMSGFPDSNMPDWLSGDDTNTTFSPIASEGFRFTQAGLYLVTAVVACSAFTVGDLALPVHLKTRNVLRWETYLT